jgi:hypothetical protein
LLDLSELRIGGERPDVPFIGLPGPLRLTFLGGDCWQPDLFSLLRLLSWLALLDGRGLLGRLRLFSRLALLGRLVLGGFCGIRHLLRRSSD